MFNIDPDCQLLQHPVDQYDNIVGVEFNDKNSRLIDTCLFGVPGSIIPDLIFELKKWFYSTESFRYQKNNRWYWCATYQLTRALQELGLSWQPIVNGFQHPTTEPRQDRLFGTVLIETQTDCNRKCSFCAHGIDRPVIKDKLEQDTFVKILDELSEIDFRGSIGLCHINEPLLDPNIVDKIRLTREKCPHAFISLVSNGDLLTENLYADLLDAGLNKIKISVYSQRHLEDLGRWRSRQGIIFVDMFSDLSSLENRTGQLIGFEPVDLPCYRPSQMLVIKASGKVALCCSDMYGDHIMGDVLDESLVDIWYSQKFQKYRVQLKTGREGLKPCEDCSYSGKQQNIIY
jgi:radical SAM protein with 4Fe4S-binding SPASM domain